MLRAMKTKRLRGRVGLAGPQTPQLQVPFRTVRSARLLSISIPNSTSAGAPKPRSRAIGRENGFA
jgi:hypothetical protein